jgi:hypothetical protein
VEARPSDGAQSLPADAVIRRHKDAYSGAEQLFEVLASIDHPLREIMATGKLQSVGSLVVMITVQHDLKAPLRNTHTEVVDERLILV